MGNGILRRLLGETRLYRAFSQAYDDWQREQSMRYRPAQFARCGQNVQIDPRVVITDPGRVAIGDWTTIQSQVALHSQGGIHIGRYVGIGYRAMILSFQHRYRNSERIPFDNGIFLHPVIIRDFAWIGWGSMLLPGVEIGEGAIVGMGSVVTKDVPPLAIVLGNPAEVVGHRSEEHFARCRDAGLLCPHRIGTVYQKFEEMVPLMVRRRYPRELRELGLLGDAAGPDAAGDAE